MEVCVFCDEPPWLVNIDRVCKNCLEKEELSSKNNKEYLRLIKQIDKMENKELTFGQKAVGVKFNPSGDEGVNKAKQLSADLIDLLKEYKNVKTDYEAKKVSWTTNVLFTAAFNAVVAAQMAVFKYLTWND